MNLSNIDIRILEELQQNADQTNLALAEKVGLSAPACLKRVRRLKASGVIKRIVAIVSPDVAGRRLNMIVEIKTKVDDAKLDQQFIAALGRAPEVKQCYQVTGEIDFVLIVNVANIFEYESFCERVIYGHKDLKKFTTLISIRCTKFDLCEHVLS
jgi:Lrp/AsnC family leucine-responsive transcriptional regulator